VIEDFFLTQVQIQFHRGKMNYRQVVSPPKGKWKMEIEIMQCEECGNVRPLVKIFTARWCAKCVEENNPE